MSMFESLMISRKDGEAFDRPCAQLMSLVFPLGPSLCFLLAFLDLTPHFGSGLGIGSSPGQVTLTICRAVYAV